MNQKKLFTAFIHYARAFAPASTYAFKNYKAKDFFADLASGLTVGIVAIPLSAAFAIASGASPVQGLLASFAAGLIISALGGSKFQIGGPTGAFVIIIYGIIEKHGMHGLIAATFMAGLLIVIFGLINFGSIIKYIPFPVIAGFTSGIAVTILAGQLKDFFGLQTNKLPAHFLPKMQELIRSASTFNLSAAAIAIAAITLIVTLRKIAPKAPAALITAILASVAVWAFNLPATVIGNVFGSLSNSLPHPATPVLDAALLIELLPAAFSIALLGSIESLLSAVVADRLSGSIHNAKAELVAQGLANMGSAFLGGIPVTGAVARTAVNVRSGGVSPLSGIVHAFICLLSALFLGPWMARVPLAALAGILAVVCYDMAQIKMFAKILKSGKSDAAVLLTAFGLTVFEDLIVGVIAASALAGLLFIRRLSKIISLRQETNGTVAIVEIEGPLFFGAASKLHHILAAVGDAPVKTIIINLEKMPLMDITAAMALQALYSKTAKNGLTLLIANIRPQPVRLLKKLDLWRHLNLKENLSLAEAQTLALQKT